MKFSIKKKGYDPIEVDNYVAQSEQALFAQKERIIKLKNKVAAVEKELQTYYEKKDLIITALSEAIKKAEEIERQANQKYDLEIQRLRQFHAKWTDYYDKLFKKYPSSMKKTDDFNRDMDKILKEAEWNSAEFENLSDEVDSLYNKEKKRIEKNIAMEDSDNDLVKNESLKKGKANETKKIFGESQKLTPLDRIKNYLENEGIKIDKAADDEPSESALEERVLSLEEALHPKQDLAGIMRDLGLIED